MSVSVSKKNLHRIDKNDCPLGIPLVINWLLFTLLVSFVVFYLFDFSTQISFDIISLISCLHGLVSFWLYDFIKYKYIDRRSKDVKPIKERRLHRPKKAV